MRSKLGAVCMLSGTVLVLAALCLFLLNQRENNAAGISVEKILPQVLEQIGTQNAVDGLEGREDSPNPCAFAMTEVEIDGYAYVGYLSIPAINLEVPVMSEWDYTRLKIAPCRYAGSAGTGNLVICAHNYTRHFGPIRNLVSGDLVYFTDMDGMIWKYEVVLADLLSSAEVEDMTAGDYALTLFTCTYSGQSRVTVRCKRIDNGRPVLNPKE